VFPFPEQILPDLRLKPLPPYNGAIARLARFHRHTHGRALRLALAAPDGAVAELTLYREETDGDTM